MRNSQYGVPQISLITTRRLLESSFTVCGNFPEEAGQRHRKNEVRIGTDGALREWGKRWDDDRVEKEDITQLARDDTTPTSFAAWRKERKRKVIQRHSHNLGNAAVTETQHHVYRDRESHKVKENPSGSAPCITRPLQARGSPIAALNVWIDPLVLLLMEFAFGCGGSSCPQRNCR